MLPLNSFDINPTMGLRNSPLFQTHGKDNLQPHCAVSNFYRNNSIPTVLCSIQD